MKILNYISIAVFLLCFLFLPQSSLADEYEISVIKIEVFVQPNGDVHIVEHRTYVFDGSFTWADYRLPLEGYTSIKDIKVSADWRSFINKNSEEPGTYIVQKSDDEIRVKWFYELEDVKRTFTISYTLEGAIVVGQKWAEFFWNYISDDREKDTDSLQIELHLPTSPGTDSLFVWKRGAQTKITIHKKPAGYVATAANLDDDESVQIRSVFPQSVFNAAISTTDSSFTLVNAQNSEKAYQAEWTRQQARDKRLAGYGRILIVIVSGLSILVFLYFYRKYGKRHKAREVLIKETIDIPGDLKPAVIGWLMLGRTITSNHLMATLLDLARRKHFIIKEQEPEDQWLQEDKKVFTIERLDAPATDNMTEWEAELKDFVSNQIEEGNNRLDELFSKNQSEATRWFNEWKEGLTKYCKAKHWYDRESIKGMKWSMGVQFPLLILAILATIWAGPLGVIAIMLTLMLFISSIGIIHRTVKGEEIYANWNAYKEGLENADIYEIAHEKLDRHFIYAIALGLSKEHIEGVMKHYNGAFYWFIFYGDGGASSAADVAATFSTLAATGAAPGVGGGVGASAGVAGGGASGGAG